MNPENSASQIAFHPASGGKRLLGYLIDSAVSACVVILPSIVALVLSRGTVSEEYSLVFGLLGYIFFFAYFILSEFFWQKTLGKLATGTKVVRQDGARPRFFQIVGRTFLRLIPFEPFSFLGPKFPVGWHDTLSRTLVVPAQYMSEDVAKIDAKSAKDRKKAWIWIVVIVLIIPLIGVISSIIIATVTVMKGDSASLSSSRAEETTIPQGSAVEFESDF